MKNYLIVLVSAAIFFCAIFLLRGVLSEILVYIFGVGGTAGIIVYLMYHHWGKRKQKYGEEVKTDLHHNK
jgi:nicotinamide riboside transporter PnuC